VKGDAAVLMLAVLLVGGAAAQESEGSHEIAADLAGPWQIVPVDGAPVCAITLGSAPAPGGWRAEIDPLCRTHVPAAADTAGWTFADGMRLLDAQGATLMHFEEDETALPSSPNVAAPAFYLVPAIPGFDRLRQPGEWEGRWKFTVKGQKPCVLRFGPPRQIDGQHSGGTVSVQRCGSAELRRMNRWYAEGISLMLAGPQDAQIIFSPDSAEHHRSGDGRWRLARFQAR
jgi:hypothetical protein